MFTLPCQSLGIGRLSRCMVYGLRGPKGYGNAPEHQNFNHMIFLPQQDLPPNPFKSAEIRQMTNFLLDLQWEGVNQGYNVLWREGLILFFLHCSTDLPEN